MTIIFFGRLIVQIISFIGLLFVAYSPNNLNVTQYSVHTSAGFSASVHVLQISDVHNHVLNYDNGTLTELLADYPIDYVFYTGDLIDEHTTNLDVVEELFTLFAAYPSYLVYGNHEYEASVDIQSQYANLINQYGINRTGSTFMNGIHIATIDDPEKYVINDGMSIREAENQYLTDIHSTLDDIPISDYTILLAHRPSFFHEYVTNGADLVFSGHTHGGQVHFLGEEALMYLLNGFRPVYLGGKFTYQQAVMINSRGMGFSSVPLRLGAGTTAEVTLTEIEVG